MDNSGQAFPIPGSPTPNGEGTWPEYGMTIRDYFAGQAMLGLIPAFDAASIGLIAYSLADSMIRARTDLGATVTTRARQDAECPTPFPLGST